MFVGRNRSTRSSVGVGGLVPRQGFEQVDRLRHHKREDQSIGFGQRERTLDCCIHRPSIADLDERARREEVRLAEREGINERDPALQNDLALSVGADDGLRRSALDRESEVLQDPTGTAGACRGTTPPGATCP